MTTDQSTATATVLDHVHSPSDPSDRLAEVKSDGRLRVWCPDCDAHHIYSRPTPGSDEIRMRQSHCFVDDSRDLGEVITLVEVGPVGTLPKPKHRARPYYPKDGGIMSGYRRAEERRAAKGA